MAREQGEAAPAENDVAAEPARERRLKTARHVVSSYRAWSITAAATPLPLVDGALIAGVQLRMLHRLAKLYGVRFERERVMPLLAALLGGWTPLNIGVGAAGIAAKMVPGIGTLIGIGTAIGTTIAATDQIGDMFIRHFEAGGTFRDFDPKKYRKATAANASP